MKMEESKRRETEELLWEEVEREHVLQDEWIDFRRLSYRLPDGTVSGPYYTYSRRDYVVIVASDTDGNYLCVRQYRQGVNAITTEVLITDQVVHRRNLRRILWRAQNANFWKRPVTSLMNGRICLRYRPMLRSRTIMPIYTEQKTAERCRGSIWTISSS